MGGTTRSRLREAISHHHLIVRYDKHGCGLSHRDRTDFSLDFEVRTIEAIVKKLGLKSFVLWGQGGIGGAAAIAYAAKSPEPVSHLILCNAQARWHGAPGWGGVSPETFRAFARSDSRMASLAMLERYLGSGFDVPAVQWFLRLNREGVTPEIYDQLVVAYMYDLDTRTLLPRISVPTLVVHYRNNLSIPFEAGRELAAEIPEARFVPLEGDAHYPYMSDARPLRRAIAEFLGDPIEDDRQPAADSAKFQPVTTEQGGVFCREGEFWTIACLGQVFRLKDVRGLAYIAYLLAHPREEVHVLSLASKANGEQGEAGESAEPVTEGQAAESGVTVDRMGDAGEMLDAQAKASYKRRTVELREQLEEARELNQLERVDQLEEEMEAVGRELSRAVGLGGRDRRAASSSERARINVTRAIKVALERIAEHNSVLAALLTSSIRTGTFCSYTPDSRLPASWQL
jgi:pimeloyl-ACP methyl ester carboxylesterase